MAGGKLPALVSRLAPFAGPLGVLFACSFFCTIVVDKARKAHVDENGLLSESTIPVLIRNAPQIVVPPVTGSAACFTELRITGRRAPLHDAFYVVVNGELEASRRTVDTAAAHWFFHRGKLASAIVVLTAANASCLARVGAAIDPSFRVKGAVVVNTTSTLKRDMCIDVLADWGTQPNHDLPLIAAMSGAEFFTCPRQYYNDALQRVAGAAIAVASVITSALPEERAQRYFTELHAMIHAFTTGRDPSPRAGPDHLAVLSAFRLGVPGYPPAFALREVPGRAATADLSELHQTQAAALDKVVWSMNAMNERLHHSFAVWFPLGPVHFIEQNAAQLQALIVVGGILVSGYCAWKHDTVRVRGRFGRHGGSMILNAATALDAVTVVVAGVSGALVCYVLRSPPWVIFCSMCVCAFAYPGIVGAIVPVSRHAPSAAVIPFCMVGLGTVIFALSAVSPPTATAVAVSLGLSTLHIPDQCWPRGRVVLRLLQMAAQLAGLTVLDALLSRSESPAVAAAVAFAGLASGTRFVPKRL
jgi:hypothetical protein